MKTDNLDTSLLENYFGLLRNLSPEIKLGLIEKLSKTLKLDFTKSKSSIQKSFGAWQSDKSAEEISAELRESRNFNRDIEPL